MHLFSNLLTSECFKFEDAVDLRLDLCTPFFSFLHCATVVLACVLLVVLCSSSRVRFGGEAVTSGVIRQKQKIEQTPRPHSLFLDHGSAIKTLIAHRDNTDSYAG